MGSSGINGRDMGTNWQRIQILIPLTRQTVMVHLRGPLATKILASQEDIRILDNQVDIQDIPVNRVIRTEEAIQMKMEVTRVILQDEGIKPPGHFRSKYNGSFISRDLTKL